MDVPVEILNVHLQPILSYTLFEFLNRVSSEIQPLDREALFRKSSLEFLKRLAPTLNTNASESPK